MKFEVLYANGIRNDVELEGTTASVGRDPSCDLVLNDARCSRKHAVLEAGPQGISIRDNGSANGVFVNGKKIERSILRDGDIVRLGETVLKVVPENVTGTLVMEQSEFEQIQETEPLARPRDLGPEGAPPPAQPEEAARPAKPSSYPPGARPAPVVPPPPRVPPVPAYTTPPPYAAPPMPMGPIPLSTPERPLTVSALALLWVVAAVAFLVSGLGLAAFGGLDRVAAGLGLVAAVAAAVLAGLTAYGLWSCAPWGRLLQLALSGLGVLTCVFTLPSAAALFYMLRPHTRGVFDPTLAAAPPEEGSELAFTLAIVGTLALGALLTAGAFYVFFSTKGPH